MKRSDIPDGLVVKLAKAWHEDYSQPGVIVALMERGVPRDLAIAKVNHLVKRGLLECGTTINYCWPVEGR